MKLPQMALQVQHQQAASSSSVRGPPCGGAQGRAHSLEAAHLDPLASEGEGARHHAGAAAAADHRGATGTVGGHVRQGSSCGGHRHRATVVCGGHRRHRQAMAMGRISEDRHRRAVGVVLVAGAVDAAGAVAGLVARVHMQGMITLGTMITIRASPLATTQQPHCKWRH